MQIHSYRYRYTHTHTDTDREVDMYVSIKYMLIYNAAEIKDSPKLTGFAWKHGATSERRDHFDFDFDTEGILL